MIFFIAGVLSLLCVAFILIKQASNPLLEKSVKIGASVFFVFYLAYRFQAQWISYQKFAAQFTFFSWLNWALVMALFVFFLISYLVREAPKARASKPAEVIIPLICAVLPFMIVESTRWYFLKSVRQWDILGVLLKPFYVQSPAHWNIYSIFFLIVGGALTVAAMASLKKSFSILTEVREPVFKGVYRWIRHPMYLGEILSTVGLCFLAPSYFNLFATILFAVLLFYRSKLEEAKITSFCPEYGDYQKRTGWIF